MAKKKAAKGVNKSQAIRDYKAANPDAGPTAIVAALGEQGLTVTSALVSNVLTTAKKGKKTGKKRGRPPKAVGKKPGRPPKAASSGPDVNLNALIAAKKLVDQLGGNVAQAKAALDALAKLQ